MSRSASAFDQDGWHLRLGWSSEDRLRANCDRQRNEAYHCDQERMMVPFWRLSRNELSLFLAGKREVEFPASRKSSRVMRVLMYEGDAEQIEFQLRKSLDPGVYESKVRLTLMEVSDEQAHEIAAYLYLTGYPLQNPRLTVFGGFRGN